MKIFGKPKINLLVPHPPRSQWLRALPEDYTPLSKGKAVLNSSRLRGGAVDKNGRIASAYAESLKDNAVCGRLHLTTACGGASPQGEALKINATATSYQKNDSQKQAFPWRGRGTDGIRAVGG